MISDFTILQQPRFQQPDGWQWRNFRSSAGFELRCGFVFPPQPAKVAIVCLPGFAEFAEKYFETAHNMLERGHAFFVMDWLGQGGSDRLLKNRHKIHSRGFEQHLKDLKQFLSEQVEPQVETNAPGAQIVFLGHSMGGHLGLRYLHDNQDKIHKAAFSAPMLSIIQLDRFPVRAVNILSAIFKLCGDGYAPGAGDWPTPLRSIAPGQSRYSSDETRDRLQKIWFDSNPQLQVGGPTFRWLAEAVKSCRLLQRQDYLSKIGTPILLAAAGQDEIVASHAILKAAACLPNAACFELTGARHEILMERDEIRNQFLARFDDFVYA